MKTAKMFSTLLLALFVFAACDSQVLPDDEWEKEEEGGTSYIGPKNWYIFISQDYLEPDNLLRKEDKEIRLSPDSGSFTISVFYRWPWTVKGMLKDELHISTHEIREIIGGDFLRLKSVQSISKLEAHYTYEYGENRSGGYRAALIFFSDDFNIPKESSCSGFVTIIQNAYASDE